MDGITTISNSNLSQIIGIIGAILAIVGTFSPLISIPIIGSISMMTGISFGLNSGTMTNEISLLLYGGIIIIILSVISIGLILKRKYKWVSFCAGSIILIMVAYVYFRILQLLDEMRRSSPGLLGDIFTKLIRFDFGFAILVIGGILICISAYFTPESENKNSQ